MRVAQPTESRELAAWIGDRHYLGPLPGYALAIEYMLGRERVGGSLWGSPTARGYRSDAYGAMLQLTRLYLVDDTPDHAESRALALARKHIRTWLPRVTLLVTYSDPAQGHEGTIYAADGWTRFGLTKGDGHSFESRPGRRARGASRKQRWVRTP
jgi:hypothetical protein